ncbi:MAG: methylmalonyl Co-A mutase-associated GTPase MeaB [Bacteroidales bacterium]|jgi:LAO/AO transport system kinase|nr:methylmalonyl Co-A mutase-associated GTPase MeaB [Bacteroidales bacterium]
MIEKDHTEDSALKVNEGIEQPGAMNPEAARKFRDSIPKELDAAAYVEGIREGNRSLLSKAITLVESALPRHQQLAQEIIGACVPLSGKSVRVGITGVPGVGKSTFIEALGKYLTGQGHNIAVLAIDPSSQRTKGSILGDKTRMEDLANDPKAYIRPSSSTGTLGGVARNTRESIILCEAAGFNIIFVETVGVGQSETAVHSMVDFFLLLMLAGAGDELQGIKRGIMEMADAIVINKADGDNIRKAELAALEYRNALHLFPASPSGWIPQVMTASSVEGKSIPEIWKMIGQFVEKTRESAFFEQHRREQSLQAFTDAVEEVIRQQFYHHAGVSKFLPDLKNDILSGKMSPYAAARALIGLYQRG